MNPRHVEVLTLARRRLEYLREDEGLVLETEEELRQALDEEGVSVDRILSILGRAKLDTKMMVEMIEARMEALAGRLKRYERQEANIKATLLRAMQILGLPSFRDPEFNAAVRTGNPKVIITDINALPEHCVRIKREPDKTLIGQILSDGGEVPGAMLSNAEAYLTLGAK